MKNITNFTQENALTLLSSDENFPVDFELAWKWLNFSRKDNAKESLLRCEFEAGRDFLLLRSEPEQNEVEGEMPKKGRRKGEQMENIWLTTECFKSWGMMATGGKGREVRKYFLECERSLKAIKANPIKKDFVLADVLEHDMLAAAVMGLSKTFSSLAEEKGLERTTGGMVNYADIAYALIFAAHSVQVETEESGLDEDMDDLRWATMVRDSFATLHPAAAARWLMDMVEKDPKSNYLKGLPGISTIPGYRQAAEIAAMPVIDRREIALAARQQQIQSIKATKASIAPFKDSIE